MTEIAGVHGPEYGEIRSGLTDPLARAVAARPDGAGGIVAYGEIPSTYPAGLTGDKTISCRVLVPTAGYVKFWEVANLRLSMIPFGSGWKPTAYVVTPEGDATVTGDEIALSSSTAVTLWATYEQASGTLALFTGNFVGAEEVNSTSFGEARSTQIGLPIWQAGAAPGGWITDAGLWDEVLEFVQPVTVTINKASGQADPAVDEDVVFDVVFSEDVVNFVDADVTLSGTAGATTAIVAGSGDTYTVTVSGMTADGTVIADIAAGVCESDATGAPNEASTSTDNSVVWSSSLVFSDDFNRADTSLTNVPNVGNSWGLAPFSATAGIQSNAAEMAGGFGAWAIAPAVGLDTANHSATADITLGLSGDIAGVFVRYTDTNNFYIGRCNQTGADTYELYKRVSGTYTLLDSLAQTFPSLPFKIRLRVNGTSLAFQVWNGSSWVTKCSATDSSHSTGSVGMFWQTVAGNGRLDNFEARDT